jgi:hypothetical protein
MAYHRDQGAIIPTFCPLFISSLIRRLLNSHKTIQMRKTQQLILKQTVINYLYLERFSLPQKINGQNTQLAKKKKKRPKNHKYEPFFYFLKEKRHKSYLNNLLKEQITKTTL